MPIPSGLLNGRGCRDSIHRCEDESSLFISIRNHSTPFLIEERRAREELIKSHIAHKNGVEDEVKSKFSAGGLPLIRTLIKYLFLVLIFPFHFCFLRLPQIINEKVLLPCFAVVKNVFERIKAPIVRICTLILAPIKAIFEKIANLLQAVVKAIKVPLLNALAMIKATIDAILAPPKKMLSKMSLLFDNCCQQLNYRVKVASTWAKLLFEDGLDYISNFGTTQKTAKKKL